MNENLREAAYNGYTEIVELLLKDVRVNPTTKDNYAIRWAAYEGHTEVVVLLLQDARVERPLKGAQAALAAVPRRWIIGRFERQR